MRGRSSSMLIHFVLEICKVVCLEHEPGLAASSNRFDCTSWLIRLDKHEGNLLISKAIQLYGRKHNISLIPSRGPPEKIF